MPHPVTVAAAAVAAEHSYPLDVIDAAAELYDANVELLDRRPLFGQVAESMALGCLSVADYLGPDAVYWVLHRNRRSAADQLTRERFAR